MALRGTGPKARLVVAEVHCGKRRRSNVVRGPPVNIDPPPLPFDGVARKPNDTLVDLQVPAMRGRDNLATDRPACAEHDDLSTVRIAEQVRKTLRKNLAGAGRKGRSHAERP